MSVVRNGKRSGKAKRITFTVAKVKLLAYVTVNLGKREGVIINSSSEKVKTSQNWNVQHVLEFHVYMCSKFFRTSLSKIKRNLFAQKLICKSSRQLKDFTLQLGHQDAMLSNHQLWRG